MICAAEFVTMKQIAIAEHEVEEKRKDAEAVQEHRAIVEDTIQFCETEISNAFTKKAKMRMPLACSIKIVMESNRLDYQHFRMLVESDKVKDRINYKPIGKVYDLPTLKEYLEKHCFVIDTVDNTYYQYGWGYHKFACLDVTIYIPKNPCNK